MKRSHSGYAVALTCLMLASLARAQDADRTVDGKVQRATEKGPVPVPGAWIVLHRVGTDRSAPLDSMRAAGNGSFRFRYQVSGAPDAIYFVSTTFRGIAYFSSPLRNRAVRGGDADLLVYDTTTATSQLSVTGRHVVVSAPRNGSRQVAEIFEISNDGSRTVVPRDSTNPLWVTRFPEKAESLTVAPGDLSAGAVAFRGGRGEVFAPISPGVRQLVVTYRLPASAFPLTMPTERPIAVLEVLLEEPRAVVEGAGLSETTGAEIDGRTFRRFVARDVGPSSVMRFKAQAPSAGNTAMILTLAVTLTAGMIVALAVWYSRRRRGFPTTASTATTASMAESDVLVGQLASLDARFEKLSNANAEERSRHAQQRAELKARIAESLARESAPA